MAALNTPRWPNPGAALRGADGALSTPCCRVNLSSAPHDSPAGLFRSGQGTEVAGLPVGTRKEPSPPRVLDGTLWKQGIWPASRYHDACQPAGATHAAPAPASSPMAAAAARAAALDGGLIIGACGASATAGAPTPCEQLGLSSHLLDNSSFAQLNTELTESAAAEAAARGALESGRESAAEREEALVAAEVKAQPTTDAAPSPSPSPSPSPHHHHRPVCTAHAALPLPTAP